MSLTRSRLALLIPAVMLAAPAGAETLKVLAIRSAAPFIYEKDGRTMGIDYEMLDYFAKSRDATLQVTWAESFPGDAFALGKGRGGHRRRNHHHHSRARAPDGLQRPLFSRAGHAGGADERRHQIPHRISWASEWVPKPARLRRTRSRRFPGSSSSPTAR